MRWYLNELYFFWIIECLCGLTFLDCWRMNILCNGFYEDKLNKIIVNSCHLTPAWILESWIFDSKLPSELEVPIALKFLLCDGKFHGSLLSDLKWAQASLFSSITPNTVPGAALPPCVQTEKQHRWKALNCIFYISQIRIHVRHLYDISDRLSPSLTAVPSG